MSVEEEKDGASEEGLPLRRREDKGGATGGVLDVAERVEALSASVLFICFRLCGLKEFVCCARVCAPPIPWSRL